MEDDASLRATALALDTSRRTLEARLFSLLDELGPHATGSLTDAEGFPLAGVNLHAICALRQEVARLRTDVMLKAQEAEAALLRLHAARRGAPASRGGGAGGVAAAAAPAAAAPPAPLRLYYYPQSPRTASPLLAR